MYDKFGENLKGLEASLRLSRHIEQLTRATASLEALPPHVLDGTHLQNLARAQGHFSSHEALLARTFADMNANSAVRESVARISSQLNELKGAMPDSGLQAQTALSLKLAVLPDMTAISSLATQIANSVPAIEAAYMDSTRWSNMLQTQMAELKIPWALADFPAVSFEGFATTSRLNIVLRHAQPFSEQSRELIDTDIGAAIEVEDDDGPEDRDAAHIDAGMNASLLAFSPNASGDVLIETGFVMKAEFAPVPSTTDGSDPGHTFHPGHYSLITSVEQNLRQMIVVKMIEYYGEKWLEKRLSEKLVAEWDSRRNQAVAEGESPLHLIHYSNFMELKDVVIGGGHWKAVFEPIFHKKEHFVTSMDRLHPIRKPLAHSRPIGRGQQLHLISEAAQILKALGIDIFGEK